MYLQKRVLTFYENRAGMNLSADAKDTLEKAEDKLRKLFSKNDKGNS
jgi:exonuclease VII small subunit